MSNFYPPPTINALDSSQRTRLIRSTRKLEKLLGSTPQVLEPISKTNGTAVRENPKGHRLYLSHSSVSSITSFSDTTESHECSGLLPARSQDGIKKTHGKQKSAHLRALMLRLRSVPSAPALRDRMEQPSPPSSRSVANSADKPTLFPPTNTTTPLPSPLFPPDDDPALLVGKASQRKRMAKLSRTLGQNVPPELVLSQTDSKPSHHQKPESERFPRLRSLWPNWRRGKVDSEVSMNDESPRDCVQYNAASSTNSGTVVRQKYWRRSVSLGPLLALTATAPNKSAVPEKLSSARRLSRSATTVRCQDTNDNTQCCCDGEWNIQDSHERAMALRNLRCR